MKGQTAIVTGGSRGIGRATAIRLAQAGANLVIAYRGAEDAAEETKRCCEEAGVQAVTVRCDVASDEQCNALVETALATFGRIDILVNNAGITRDAVLLRMDREAFDEVIAVNLGGAFNMMKAVSRPMIKQRCGRIVNVSSVSGLMGNAGQTNYAAAKAGLIGMTKAFAREVANRGITVNAVAPGFVETDMTAAMPAQAAEEMTTLIPMQRIGRPEEIAEAICFLAGENSAYITGEVLRVDGGMAM